MERDFRGVCPTGEGTVTDGEALIRSILAAPADDAPRLVYADWLEEQGRPEDAEFVRVQVELARLGFDGAFHTDEQGQLRQVPAEVERLMQRQMELWADGHGRPDLPAQMADWPIYPANTAGTRVRVRRGFVERLSCRCKDLMALAADLFARQPVTDVRLVDLQPARQRHDGTYVWHCASASISPVPLHWVPAPVWAILRERGPVTYETADEAELALSWACVRYGRGRAGLA